MGWFGRKSAAPAGRAYLPAFLQGDEGSGGFARGVDGMRLVDRVSGLELAYRDGAWTSGSVRASEILVSGVRVVGARQPAIAEPAAGTVVDAQARTAVAQILSTLRAHGLIAG